MIKLKNRLIELRKDEKDLEYKSSEAYDLYAVHRDFSVYGQEFYGSLESKKEDYEFWKSRLVEVKMEIYHLIDEQSFSDKKAIDDVIEDLKYLIPYEREHQQKEKERLERERQQKEKERREREREAEKRAASSRAQMELVPCAMQIINGQLNISVPGNWFNLNLGLINMNFIIKACVRYGNVYYTVVQHPAIPGLRMAFYPLNNMFWSLDANSAQPIIDFCSANGVFG
jgi:hypothetical protein